MSLQVIQFVKGDHTFVYRYDEAEIDLIAEAICNQVYQGLISALDACAIVDQMIEKNKLGGKC